MNVLTSVDRTLVPDEHADSPVMVVYHATSIPDTSGTDRLTGWVVVTDPSGWSARHIGCRRRDWFGGIHPLGLVGMHRTCLLLPSTARFLGWSSPDAAEAALTEIPEHLLARSRARRAAMGGGGGGDAAPAASTPATTESDSPATTAAPTPAVAAAEVVPATPDPVPPWVEAAETRKKIPAWAVPVLALLPLWAVIYAVTLDTPTPTELSPIAAGGEVYGTNCAGCHGATGGGVGAAPALSGEANVTTIFTSPADQITWVALGTAGYQAAGIDAYGTGDTAKPLTGAIMPAWIDALDATELMEVVLYERSGLNDEEFDIEQWKDGFEEKVTALLPEAKAAELIAVLEEWEAEPPTAE